MVLEASLGEMTPEYVMLKDQASGLDGIIAIDSTILGPGAGGCRFWDYPSHASMAEDAARLARGMTFKNAMAGLPLGGAKAVLRRPSGSFDRKTLFKAFGRAVEELGGRYVTAEDVGTSIQDMDAVASQTRHVAGCSPRSGLPGGDPSPWTARGVFVAMQQAAETRLGRQLRECRVAIQGVGHVGGALAQMLHDAGARLVVADVDANNLSLVAAALDASIVGSDEILRVEADILAPCALGAVLNARTIGEIRARLVCGAANNQLETQEDGARLAERGIVYAPDYVVNAGGIINVAAEYLEWSPDDVATRVDAIAARLASVFDHGEAFGLTSNVAADEMAWKVVSAAASPVFAEV